MFVRFAVTLINRPRNRDSLSTIALATRDGSENSTYAYLRKRREWRKCEMVSTQFYIRNVPRPH